MVPDPASVERLVLDLNSEDSHVAEGASEALDALLYPQMRGLYSHEESVAAYERHFASFRGSDALTPLVETLRDGSTRARVYAAQTLSLLGDRRCLPILREAISDPDARIRSAATRAYQFLPDRSASQALIRRLRDSETDVVVNAARALGRLGDEAAVGPLLELCSSKDWRHRACAIEALGGMLASDALPRIRDALQDKHKRVREAAKAGLANFELANRGQA